MPLLLLPRHSFARSKLSDMCGRYGRRSDKQRIAEVFAVHAGLDEVDFGADDDIAPGSVQPVVRIEQSGERQIEMMRWGFRLPDRFLFNARSEGIENTKFWKEAFSRRRCIVPADSFYEWRKVKSGKKPKFEITLPNQEPFGMAGLWAMWKNLKTDEWEPTFAILTGEANQAMQAIHSRQPAILERRDYDEYLTVGDGPPVHLLGIFPAKEMKLEAVVRPCE